MHISTVLVGLLLSGTALSAAASHPKDITSRQVVDSSELQLEEFNPEELNALNEGQQLSECDENGENCEVLAQLHDTTGKYDICGRDETYRSSYCQSENAVVVICEHKYGTMTSRRLDCRPDEVCIQNSLDPPYAKCKRKSEIVEWATKPEGEGSTSTKYVHPQNKNIKGKVGNMYYDRNHNLIKVSVTQFYHEPGNQPIGVVRGANRAYSNEVDWRSTENAKVEVTTGGSGNIKVFTFLV